MSTRVAVSVLLGAFVLCAQQDPRGRIEGLVGDATGAVIPLATVRATNIETGVAIGAASNDQGVYEILYLLPGTYRLAVEMQGFKTWTRPDLELRTGDRLRVDVELELGNVAESVEVKAESPVLESASSNVGQVLSNKEASELPLRGGSLAWLYSLAPGVIQPSIPAGGPWNIDQASDASAAGAGSRSFDFNVDGVSNNSYGGRTAFVPPPDMVQEIKIETTSYDASIGHSTGGSVNVSLKTGTNALHGSFGAALAKGPMVTRNFFVNRFIFDPATGPVTDQKIKANTPTDRWLRMSGAVGGPVLIPKLYNGKNRTFWMFGYQGHDRAQPVASLASVPAEAQRGGDFSALLALGAQYQIYDPFTTVAQGARFARQPLAANRIPSSRIDATAKKFLAYFPAANTAGTPDSLNNYSTTTPKEQVLKQPIVRIDHNFSEKHRLYARYSHSNFDGKFDQLVKNSDVRGRLRSRPHRGAALDNVWVLSPSMVFDVRYGFTWFSEVQSFYNMGWDLKEFGFPDSLIREMDPKGISFPQTQISGLMQLGNDGGFRRVNYTHSLLSVVNWMRGNHSLKFGADFRNNYENNKDYNNVSPQLVFDPLYTRGPLDNSTAAPAGQGLASLLFGIPTGGGVNVNDSRAELSGFYSAFVQDDWRVRRSLTLNLGLRWEVESPIVERFNRTTLDFDFTTPNPIEAQARAQYAQAPIPEVPASAFRTLGGVTFAGVGANPRNVRDPYYRAVMPRAGFAWQWNARTVVRGGYGIYFGLLGADFSDVAQPGFNQRTNIVPSNDNGMTYVASIANPLPSGVEKPRGAAGGLTTYLGRGPGFFSRDGRRPYTQRWSLSVQYEPVRRSVIEIGYIGSRSIRQRATTEFNPAPRSYLSTLPVRDQAAIDFLSAQVNNPFRGIEGFAGTAYYTGRTTGRSQLLRPLPHFTGLTEGLPAGMSWYHGLTASFQRRFTSGFQFQGNYTWSKTMSATEYLNDTDALPLHVVNDLDRPHRFAASGLYELPFARRSRVFGGWQIQAIYQWQSGPPLSFGNVIYTGTYPALRLDGGARSLERWFNTDGFERDSRRQLANNIRTLPPRIAQARADGMNMLDLGAFKYFTLREGIRLQLRADAESAPNHPNFNPPNTNPSSTLFGRVSATQTGEGERRVFAGLRLIF
jgi:hypothetical protein